MSTCPSCGGVLGRDCFNPRECAEIGHAEQMRIEHGYEQAQGELAQLTDALQARDERIRLLEDTLRETTLTLVLQRPAYRGPGCFCDGFHNRETHEHQDKCIKANAAIECAKALLATKETI